MNYSQYPSLFSRHFCLLFIKEICAENFQCLGSTDDQQHQSSSPPIHRSPFGSSSSDLDNSPSIFPSRIHPGRQSVAIGAKSGREGGLDVLEFLREEMDKFRRKKKLLARNPESEVFPNFLAQYFFLLNRKNKSINLAMSFGFI
jgi:hypothetical protein